MASNSIDPEKSFAPTRVLPFTSSSSSPAPNNICNEYSLHTPLQLFQLLVGLQTPVWITQGGRNAGRGPVAGTNSVQAENIGLYRRAKEQERNSRIAYICQGVPQRYRKAQDQYQALILEIEMAERSFVDAENSKDGLKLDPRAEEARLKKLYDIARADQQANCPDLYVSTGATSAKDSKDLAKQLDDAKAEMVKFQSGIMAQIAALTSKMGSQGNGNSIDAIHPGTKS